MTNFTRDREATITVAEVWEELSSEGKEALLNSYLLTLKTKYELHDNLLIVDPEANIIEWTQLGREVADYGARE